MQIERPKAGNYNANDTMRKTLSGKADSVFSYRHVNPYSVAFDKFKREQNENLDQNLWQEAANKGELDQYINLLVQNPKQSGKLKELKDTYSVLDYDTTMLALSYDAIKDDKPEDRFDGNGNLIGTMTQRELIDKVLQNQQAQWDAQIVEDMKRSGNFWQKSWKLIRSAGTDIANNAIDFGSNVVKVGSQFSASIVAASKTLEYAVTNRGKTFEDISRQYALVASGKEWEAYQALSFEEKANILKKGEELSLAMANIAMDIRRKYSYNFDGVTGEFSPWGKIMYGVSNAAGYMALSLFGMGKIGMYLPMFTGNVQENTQLGGYNPNYSKIITNAGIKTGVEMMIEYATGKIFGFSKLDKLIGWGDDAAKITAQTVNKQLTASTVEAIKMVGAQAAKNALKEGVEEVLQEASGMAIDYLYGDQYRDRSKEGFTLETFKDTFVIGAATSLVIGGVSNLTVKRGTGVDQAGLTYEMGLFQSITYNQALQSMQQWQATANDAKADVDSRIAAALKLETVVATLGNLYEVMGVEKASKAELLMSDIQQYHQRKANINAHVKQGTYASSLLTKLDNEVGGKNWTKAFDDINSATNELMDNMLNEETGAKAQHRANDRKPVAYKSFKKAISDALTKLQASGTTSIDKPVDLTTEGKVDDNTAIGLAKTLGFDVMARTDGKDIIISDNVIFVPAHLQDADTQTLLKAIATQKTIINIATSIPAELLKAVIDTYSQAVGTATSHYASGEIETQAIAALMFDKNFQLKMLLKAHENNNSWGTKQVIDFIKNLKKMVAKKFDSITNEDGSKKRVLSDITNKIIERVISSLQDSIQVFNITTKSSVSYNPKTENFEIKSEMDNVLRDENKVAIISNPVVRYNAILEAIKHNKLPITNEVNKFVDKVLDVLYSTRQKTELRAIMNLKAADDLPYRPSVKARILRVLSNGTINERLDLTATLSFAFKQKLADNKMYYLTSNDSNIHYFEEGYRLIADIEKDLLNGITIAEVLADNAPTGISDAVTGLIPNFDTNKNNRFMALNYLVKLQSKNEFAILPTGQLIKLVHNRDHIIPSILNVDTTEDLLKVLYDLRDSKADKTLRLQDLFVINLGKVGEVPLAITSHNGITGYYRNGPKMISAQLDASKSAKESFIVILHEMIHAENNITTSMYDDFRHTILTNGSDSTSVFLNPNINANITSETSESILDYITTNFPIAMAHLSQFKFDSDYHKFGTMLYMLNYEENEARSISELYAYSVLGFTTRIVGDTILLVSPDGLEKWPIKQSKEYVKLPLDLVKQALHRLSGMAKLTDFTLFKEIQALMNIDSAEVLANETAQWVIPKLEQGSYLRQNYQDLVDILLYEDFTNIALPDTELVNIAWTLAIDDITTKLDPGVDQLSAFMKTLYEKRNALNDLIKNYITAGKISYVAPMNQIKLLYENKIMKIANAELTANLVLQYVDNHAIKTRSETTLIPKSFDFGDYSLVKHTGRTYMLTRQLGNGRYTNQEVHMDTLLPTNPKATPIINDQALRERFLFVINKKIEVAKNAKPEVEDKVDSKPTPKVDTKPEKVYFQWGQWKVTEFDKDHYVVVKDIDKSSNDEDATFQQRQIVNKKTLLPDTMFGSTGKPILSASERSNLLDWLANNTHPELLKVKDKDPDKERWIYKANLSEKKKSDFQLKEDFEAEVENNPFYEDNIPGNMGLSYKDGISFVKAVATFYKKYPSLREWVEGDAVSSTDQILDAFNSKKESLKLLYEELYKKTYGLTGTFDQFLKTPIYFVRTMDTDQVRRAPLNSVSLGYDLAKVPVFGQDTDYVFTGTILPTELTTYLPLSYAEGLVGSSVFSKNKPITRDQYNKVVQAKSNQTSSFNKTPSEDLLAKRTYISNKEAAKSNLKYFIKKGKPIQMHSAVAAFVEGTTADFDKLSKFFKVRIQDGTLTKHSIAEYISTTATINEYTWKAIAKYIYQNEALADLGPSFAKFFLDITRLEKYAIIARLTEDEAVLNNINKMLDFKKLENEFNNLLKDPAFFKKYETIKKQIDTWWEYNQEGKLERRDDLVIDEKQLLPIFMRHYDGTLKSINNIYTIAKTVSGKQLLKSLHANTGDTESNEAGKTTKISSGNAAVENNNLGVKSKGSKIYNWLDKIRRNEIDYEITGNDPSLEQDTITFEQLSLDDKLNMIYDYLWEQALSYTNNPTQQEEYEADQEINEAIDKLTEENIDKLVLTILADARNAIDVPTTKVSEVDPDAPTRKNLKDDLRNKLRTLSRRLAGLKVNYNRLSPEVQKLLNFSVNNTTINTNAYTNLSDAELMTLAESVAKEIETLKVAQQQAKELEKTKATVARKIAALQAREQKATAKEAKLKAREKALKEGTDLRSKINITYDTKVAKQTFTITGPTEINPKLQSILNRTWDKTVMSKVKYMDDSVQTVQNKHIAEEFYKAHAEDLSNMGIAEIEEVTEWLIGARINASDSVAIQTFEATRFFILAYIYNETATGLFSNMNANLKLELGNYLKAIQTSAGTLLSLVKQVKDKLNPLSIITTALFKSFDYEIPEAQQELLAIALAKGNVNDITRILHTIKQDAMRTITPEKTSTLRKIAAVRSMSMTSSPMTWVRNIISNYALQNLNPVASKLGNAFFPNLTAKTQATPTQYKLNGKITPQIQQYITEQFIDSGFFDETIDQLSKYNPSQVIRHKKAGQTEIISDMLIHSIYNQFYSEAMFDSKLLNQIHAFLMQRLSDKKWVRTAAVKYLGKLLAETNHHLDENGNVKQGIDDDVMKSVANAFALATTDYMHSDNFFSHVERWLSQHSQTAWAGYKIIMPFATASWNWFKAAMRYSPVGLGQAIVRLSSLEKQIMAREVAWEKGESQIAPELTSYLVRRDLGSGIIGTIAFGFGAILAALGYISLEDDDWGTPKLLIGNLRLDISSIFGSSSALAGAAFIHTLKNKNLAEALDAMAEPLVDGFFFTDLLQMDANSPKGWFEWTKYQANSIILSFIPSMVRWISGATYTGVYRTNTLFQRAVVRLPFLGQAFNVPKKTDIYTGDSDGSFWDIVHRLVPYFEIVTKSQAQTTTEMYGLNKEELNGTYKINDVPFKTTPSETARINQLYGSMNAKALTEFYAGKTAYRVQTESGRYATKYYANMTPTEISNALDQIFSKNSNVAKVSAWLEAGHTYYTNDRELFNTLRKLGYTKVYMGNKGFVE